MSAEGLVSRLRVVPGRARSRHVVRAAVAVSAAGLVVKAVAMGKEAVVAALYGRSDAMDAYLAAFLIPNLLINLIAESMNQALIPTLIRVRTAQGQVRARQLFSSSMLATTLMLAASAAGIAIFARRFFPLIAASFSTPKLDLAVHIFYVLLPCVVLGGLASNYAAVLNTLNQFGIPALAPVIIPFSIIGATLAFHHALGIWALAFATPAGATLQAVLLAAGVRANGYSIWPRWYGRDGATSEVARQFGPMLLSSVVASGGLLVDQAMAAMLSPGSVSALVFAGRFVSVVVTLFAGSISTAVAPYFSELVAQRQWGACRASLRDWTLRTALVSIPIAVVLIVGAQPLIRITLQRGAFAARDTRVVAPVLAMYAIQIPFFAVSRVYYRFIVAMRRTGLVLACGLINLALDIVLNLILMRSMGVAGIALATSLWTVSTCAFLWFWTRRLLDTESRVQG